MADIFSNLTGTAEVPDALRKIWDATFLIAAEQADVVSPFARTVQVAGKSQRFMIYDNLAIPSALNEREDPASAAMADDYVELLPVQEGQVVSQTDLASFQSGGQLDLAIIQALGQNMAHTVNIRGTRALEASGNASNFNVGGAADASVAATDIMSPTAVNIAYNKLSRESAPRLAGGLFAAMAHDDVLHDLRNSTAANSFVEVNKYTNLTPLTNEIGTYGGFRWFRNNDASIADQPSTGTVDLYKSVFMGADALLMGYNVLPGMRVMPGADKFGRFTHISWYGVFDFKVYNKKNVLVVKSASSLGANAS